MTFTITYRGKDGALREERVEAASRAECAAECRKRGIAPTKIREGWRASTRADRPGRVVLVAAISVLLLFLAGGVWWWMAPAREDARPPKVAKPVKPKAAKTAKPAAKPVPKPTETNAPPKAEEKPAMPEFVKRPGALQLPDGKVLTFPAPKEGEIRKVYAYGHMYECDHEGNFRDVTRRQLFKTAFEANFLGLAVADKPFIPAFLKGLDQNDVKKILLKGYEAKGDETEEEMAQLKAYDDMRAAALQYMEEGGTFDDFVDYFAKQVKNERETNALCLREVMTLYKQGKYAEAKELAEAASVLKQQKGLKGLKLPVHVKEKLGIE